MKRPADLIFSRTRNLKYILLNEKKKFKEYYVKIQAQGCNHKAILVSSVYQDT